MRCVKIVAERKCQDCHVCWCRLWLRGNAKIVFVVPSFLFHITKYNIRQMLKVNVAHVLACYHSQYFFNSILSEFDCSVELCSNMLWLIRLHDKVSMCCIECNFSLFFQIS